MATPIQPTPDKHLSAKLIEVLRPEYSQFFDSTALKSSLKGLESVALSALEGEKESIFKYKLGPSLELEGFILGRSRLLPEMGETVFEILELHGLATTNTQSWFHKQLESLSSEVRLSGITHFNVFISPKDTSSLSYFAKLGTFDYCILIGNIETGIEALVKETKDNEKFFTIRPLEEKHIEELSQVCALSHTQDPTSRMHEKFRKKGSEKRVERLFRYLCKTNQGFVALKGDTVIGGIGIYSDETSNLGGISTVTVDPEFQRRGVAKALYFKALQSLQTAGFVSYMGHSSTASVLRLAETMRRSSLRKVYKVRVDVKA